MMATRRAAGRVRYRVWQFWQILRADPLPVAAWQEITGLLSEEESKLFTRQPIGAQQHAYRTMGQLRGRGYEDRPLLAAALLHDVGKIGAPSRWWDRPLVVLAQAYVPALASRWSQGEIRGWRRPFVVKARHAEWGAAMCEAAGSDPETVALIRHHQDDLIERNGNRQLAALQWADNQN